MTVILLFLLMSIAGSWLSAVQPPQAGGASMALFEGARVITGEERPPIDDAAFLVENGRFTRIGRRGEIQVPAGATRVDLSGKTVIPALVDIHTHVGYERYTGVNGAPLGPETVGRGVFNFGPHNYTRENILDHLSRFAYFGVAAAWSAGYDYGELPYQIRDEIAAGKHPNTARFLASGPGLSTPEAVGPERGRQSIWAVASEAEARMAVRKLSARKVEMLKLWNERMPSAVYRAIIDEAHASNLRVAVHPGPEMADVKEMIRAGVDVLLHPVDCRAAACAPRSIAGARSNRDELDALINARQRPLYGVLASASARWAYYSPYFDPPHQLLRETLAPLHLDQIVAKYGAPARQRPEGQKRAAEEPIEWDSTMAAVKQDRAAGLRIALGSDEGGTARDKPVRFFAHVDLENMTTMGMSPAEAIVAATTTSAAAVGLGDLGGVVTGKEASFVVLDADPLEDIRNTRQISRVFLRGREVDRAGLRAAWAKSWSSGK
jgi:imidazolonepropionase-like amidohydrolase